MNDTYYVKTYKPLAVWSVLFIGISIGAAIVGSRYLDHDILSKMIMMVINLGIVGLFYLIYKGEYVYWINGGPQFEEAYEAGSHRRRQYALAHLKLFVVAGTVVNVFMIVSMIWVLPYYVDLIVFAAGMIVAAIRSMKIRF